MQDEHTQRLKSIGDIASLVNAGSGLDTILEGIVYAVCHHSVWSMSSIMALDREAGHSILVKQFDPYTPKNRSHPDRWDLSISPTERVIESNYPLVIPDAPNSAEFPGYRADAVARGYRTVVILPLRATDSRGRPMVLAVQSRQQIEVTEQELSFLETVTNLAAIAVEKTARFEAEHGRTAKMRHLLEIHAELMEQVLAGGTLASLMRTIEALLPEPVVVVDLTSNVVLPGRSPEPARVPDEHWREAVRTRGARKIAEQVRRAQAGSQRFDLTASGLDIALDGHVEPLTVEGQVVGALIVFRGKAAGDEMDNLLIEQAKFALGVLMMRNFIRFRSETNSQAELFGQLFSGNWRDREEMIARAGHLGIDLTGPARLVAIGFLGGDARTLNETRDAHLHRALAQASQTVLPRSVSVIDGADVVVFSPLVEDGPEKSWAAPLQRLLEEARWVAGANAAIATSETCRRLEDYVAARAECTRVLSLARLFGKTGVLQASDFGPFAVLLSAADHESVRQFVADTLGRIEAHDRDHKAELLRTLAAFIDNGCRYQATADALAIHVTTLRYRLERLREMFDVDVEQPDRRFGLELALRLRDLIRA
ncbi:MAG: helix-turn-helix domain-containing protein [Alphaproteobacteria bacterium]